MKKLFRMITLPLIALILSTPVAYAKSPATTDADIERSRGCCAAHGGTTGCDFGSGYLHCQDGTLSKTCQCDGKLTLKPTVNQQF